MQRLRIIRSLRILAAIAISHIQFGCALYSPGLAPYEPKIHNVREGDFIDLENSGGGVYIEKITSGGIFIGRRNGYGSWKITKDASNSMGNGEHLYILTFDPRAKTATIKQTETDRRGFGGAFDF